MLGDNDDKTSFAVLECLVYKSKLLDEGKYTECMIKVLEPQLTFINTCPIYKAVVETQLKSDLWTAIDTPLLIIRIITCIIVDIKFTDIINIIIFPPK